MTYLRSAIFGLVTAVGAVVLYVSVKAVFATSVTTVHSPKVVPSIRQQASAKSDDFVVTTSDQIVATSTATTPTTFVAVVALVGLGAGFALRLRKLRRQTGQS